MFKKALVMMLALVAVPTFALADWTITASTSPGNNLNLLVPTTADVTNAVPPLVPAWKTIQTSSVAGSTSKVTKIKETNALINSVSFAKPTVPAGYTLTSVTIDGAIDGVKELDAYGNWTGNWTSINVAGPFVVNRSVNGQFLTNHTIVANYASNAANTFAIKSIASAGGWISKSQTVAKNGSATFTVTSNPGQVLAGVSVDGGPTIAGPPAGATSLTYTFSNVIAPHTIQGVFTAANVPVKASLGLPPAFSTTPGAELKVLGSTIPGYTEGVTYNWSGSCEGAVLVPANTTNTATIKVPSSGDCTVGLTVTVNGVTSAAAITSTITANPLAAGSAKCNSCHATSTDGIPNGTPITLVANTAHAGLSCQRCHNPEADSQLSHSYVPYGAMDCSGCHNASTTKSIVSFAPSKNDFNNCAVCHVTTSDVHGVTTDTRTILQASAIPAIGSTRANDCIGCHDIAFHQTATANSGVRAVVGEFSKWSHHVVGTTLNNAHCVACHLEGNVVAGAVVVDTTKHMSDGKTYLRDTTLNTDVAFAWDPASPNHSGMDNFCMSCHDSNGAVSPMSTLIQKYLNDNKLVATGKTASPTNPFGDTISNLYDQLERPAVVDAKSQFATTNPSHHAVLGKKYTGRTRGDGIVARTVATASFASNSSAAMPGVRSTIFDAGKFNTVYTTYTTLADNDVVETGLRNGGSALGDDSTLHCGDCHTVGQFKPGSAKNASGFNTYSTSAGRNVTLQPTIGAHGSNNEYMLRNSAGSDARHTGTKFAGTGTFGNALGYDTVNKRLTGSQAYLVCFNCHTFQTYGSTGGATGATGTNHAGEYANQDRCNGPYNTNSEDMTGEARLESIKTNNNGTVPGVVSNTFSNFQGIQCSNCHNSGTSAANIFGGIHGSKQTTYTDGMGNTTKHIRFLPGLGNTMFVPGTKGGFTGGTQATYKNYSGYAFAKYSAVSGTDRRTKGYKPTLYAVAGVNNTPYTPDALKQAPSYTYTTGGQSRDLNWEQKIQQSVAGQTDPVAAAMGCYTIDPNTAPKATYLTSAGYPADDIRYAATYDQKGPDGREI